MDQVLECKNLKVQYGAREAVKDLSFTLNAGEILGFLGPNGAGKTSAIRTLTTILPVTNGAFTVAGADHNHPENIRRAIGVLPESHGYPAQVTAMEYLTGYGRLFGMTKEAARTKATQLLQEVGLGERGHSLITSYSRGMRQRLGIARALINDPRVVFLDEPTLGLDPRGQDELLGLVRSIAQERGAAIVFCSHSLAEVEDLCDSVVILREGNVVATGPISEVTGSGQSSLRVRVPDDEVENATECLAAHGDVEAVADGWLRVRLENASPNEALAELISKGCNVLGSDATGGRLHDTFLNLTESA